MSAAGSTQFAGRTAIVTGGSRGIGRDIVELLAAHGATVVSLDINPPDGEHPARSILADVSSERDVGRAFAALHRDLGPPPLVNNAGLFSTLDRRPFWDLTVDEWDRVSAVNVHSVFLCARAAAGPMREARNGRIVNLGSTSSAIGMGGLLHYVTSKAAIIGMTRSLARELGPDGVTVNAVAPGLVTTEHTRETISDDYRNRIAKTQLITEPVTGADIAEAVVYLCSDGARLVTGQTVFVNGSASMSAAWTHHPTPSDDREGGRSMKATGLLHIGLQIPRLDVGKTFYQNSGLRAEERPTTLTLRRPGRDQDQLILSEGRDKRLRHVVFSVSPGSLDEFQRSLERAGVPLVDEPPGGPLGGLWLRDPDGGLANPREDKPADTVHPGRVAASV